MRTLVAASVLSSVLAVPGAARADESATLPTAVNVPVGPGSLEGFGQGHEVSPTTGLPSLTYPLELPPGRAGLVPELRLRYAPGAGTGPVGLDWTLELPAVELSTRRGLPAYDGDDVLRLSGAGRGEELVEVAPGTWRETVEDDRPVVVTRGDFGGLRLHAVDGRVYHLGGSPATRVMGAGGVFRWELDAVEDPFGNRVELSWTREPGSDVPLLDRVTYNDGAAAVTLAWEPRPDEVRSRRAGTLLVLRHRLRAITTWVDGAAVRTYELGYAPTPGVAASLLSSIACGAPDGTRLPTWTLAYAASFGAAPVELADPMSIDPTAAGNAWVDVDGDALPDLLETVAGSWRWRRNLGGVGLDDWRPLASSPSVVLDGRSRFADVDGDGVADVLVRVDAGPDGMRAFLGGGRIPYGRVAELPLDVGFELSDPRVALMDLDVDGRVDVLRAEASDAFVWLREPDGPGYLDVRTLPPLPAGFAPSDPGVQVADVDGDRIPDLVRVSPELGRVGVAHGAGDGAFDEPVWLTDVPTMAASDRWELRDLNGDGAADLLRVGRWALAPWINRLDGSFAAADEIAWPELGDHEVVLLSDVNANGTLDVLRIPTDAGAPWRYWDLLGARPGLLSRLENGLGYTLALDYASAAQLAHEDAEAGTPWVDTVPVPAPVLVTTVEDDGHGWTRTTTHRVRDGWLDPRRRELRGFAVLEDVRQGDEHVATRARRRTFDLGREHPARAGRLLVEETVGDAGLLRRDVHGWTVVDVTAGVAVARNGTFDRWTIEGGDEAEALRARTERVFDEWGNVLEQRELGLVDPATGVDLPGDERVTERGFAVPDGAGPRDRAAWTRVEDGAGEVVTSWRRYYDGEPEVGLPLGRVTNGALSREARWLADDRWTAALRQRHDGFGNPVLLRDAEGGVVERGYDPLGRFVVREAHPAGPDHPELATLVTRDAATGRPTSVTRPGGARTELRYDGLGRPVAVIEPGDSRELPTLRHTYALDGETLPTVVTHRRVRSGEAREEPTVAHLDGLGRLRQRVTPDDDGTGAVLAELVDYDVGGAVALRVRGVYVDAVALEVGAPEPYDSTWPTERIVRDALGRVVERTFADGRREAVSHGPLVEVVRDNADLSGQPPYHDAPRRTIHDGLGRVVAIVDVLPGGDVEHGYLHDAADRLVEYVDPAGWPTTWTRDGLGNVVAMDSPDAGAVEQIFDDAGRLVVRVDGEGGTVVRDYDGLGRTRAEAAYAPDGTRQSLAVLAYDVPREDDADVDAGLGRLVAVDDDAGRVDLAYDARGRVVRRTRIFQGAHGDVSLSHVVEHDAQGRVIGERFPDGSRVTRTLSHRGLEVGVGELVPRIERDAHGRWTTIELANRAVRRRALDPLGRVTATSALCAGETLFSLDHAYDVAGSMSWTRDRVGEVDGLPALDVRLRYDDLHRLVLAEVAHGRSGYAYSGDGNVLQIGDVLLRYGEERPHAATGVADQTVDYDAAGRISRIVGDGPLAAGRWDFDAHGRLREVCDGLGACVVGVYDHEGRRAMRWERDADGAVVDEVLVFGDGVEVRRGELVRWIVVDGERVVESATAMPPGGFPRLDLPG